jgi:hypothetical protein
MAQLLHLLRCLCLQDDDCQELLDGPGHPSCTSGPLAYDLTQHTGSYMYMAPVSDLVVLLEKTNSLGLVCCVSVVNEPVIGSPNGRCSRCVTFEMCE